MSYPILTGGCPVCGSDMVHDPRDHGVQIVGIQPSVRVYYECWNCDRLVVMTYTNPSTFVVRGGTVPMDR